VLAVNKIDNEDRLKFVSEYYELGFGEPIPISAEHGRNIYELIDAIREKLSDFEGVNEENIQNDEDTIK
jgi:GTP-binding protein